MKFVKGISLFFVYPAIMFGIGYFAGVSTLEYFYPGSYHESGITQPTDYNELLFEESETTEAEHETFLQRNVSDGNRENQKEGVIVSQMRDTLNADTRYVLWEKDLMKESVVETVGKIPGEYIGMDRVQFLAALDEYEKFPPLSEMERGFVSLEVVSFAPEKVVVQRNYQYLQPSNSFYLAVRDNEVIVLLEDMETVFINTGIDLSDLPEDMQIKIIQMLWMEDEKALYNFLESHSS